MDAIIVLLGYIWIGVFVATLAGKCRNWSWEHDPEKLITIAMLWVIVVPGFFATVTAEYVYDLLKHKPS